MGCRTNWAVCLLAAGIFFAAVSGNHGLRAEDAIQVVRIVETWELKLNSPDATTTAPQVTLTLSPFTNLNSHYATFELNHQATPRFAAGGLHFHVWNGEQCLGSKHQGGYQALNTTAEVIQWKQVLQLADGNLEFSIEDGTSTTWGQFGDSAALKFSIPTSLANLNTYRPTFSVSQSGVGFGGNRVQRLAIIKLTAFTSAGQIAESDKLRIVHEAN